MTSLSEQLTLIQSNYIKNWNNEFPDILQEITDIDLKAISKHINLEAEIISHENNRHLYVYSKIKNEQQWKILLEADVDNKLNLYYKGLTLLDYALKNNDVELAKKIVSHRKFKYIFGGFITELEKMSIHQWYKHTPMYNFICQENFENRVNIIVTLYNLIK